MHQRRSGCSWLGCGGCSSAVHRSGWRPRPTSWSWRSRNWRRRRPPRHQSRIRGYRGPAGAPQACPPPAAGAPAARGGRARRRDASLRGLWRHAAPSRRGRDRGLGLPAGQFRVLRHVRPKFSCRGCEAITQAPAPSLPIRRGRATAGLLAHVLVAKYADHLPLYRQSEIYARAGSTCSARRWPTGSASRRRCCGRCWTPWPGMSWRAPCCMPTTRRCRSSRPVSAGPAPAGSGPICATSGRTAARSRRPVLYRYSPDRRAEHPKAHLGGFRGVLQADGPWPEELAVRRIQHRRLACRGDRLPDRHREAQRSRPGSLSPPRAGPDLNSAHAQLVEIAAEFS